MEGHGEGKKAAVCESVVLTFEFAERLVAAAHERDHFREALQEIASRRPREGSDLAEEMRGIARLALEDE